MVEVSNHLRKLAQRLFPEGADRDAFIETMQLGNSGRDATIWLQNPSPGTFPLAEVQPDWLPNFVNVVSNEAKAGSHELHHQGHFYCLDLSSVFAGMIISNVPAKPKVVIDICASPGGKSVFAWRSLAPELLIANEVIGKRLPALISNFKRCAISPALIISRDPSQLSETIPKTADLVIVDAPCSGQSLPARGLKSPGCFHPATINMNSNRQKRIIANSSALVKPGGYLAYTTCTFSKEENEAVVAWFLRKFPEFRSVEVGCIKEFQSKLTEQYCYRLFPQQGFGSGAFGALFQRSDLGEEGFLDQSLLGRIVAEF